MKNLLKSTLYLFVFALAGILFQISCSSDSISPTTTSTPLGKLLYYKQVASTLPGGGTLITPTICTCNYDGTNETPINVILPADQQIKFSTDQANIRLSPDGQKVFFITEDASYADSIYACDVTGGTATQVITTSAESNIELGGAY